MSLPRTLPLVVLALALAAAPARADERAAEDPAAAKAEAAVEAALAPLDGTPQGTAKALAALKRLPASAYGALLERAFAGREGTAEGDLLARAVAEKGGRTLQAHLEATFRGPEPDQARLAALQRLARFGSPALLEFAVAVVGGIDGTWLPTRRVKTAWEAAWRHVTAGRPFRRDLRAALTKLPAPLRAPSAQVLAGRHDAEALGAVVDAAVAAPEESAELLTALTRASRLLLHRAGAAEAVEAGLHARDDDARRAAAELAGRVRALGSLEGLLVGLEAEDAGVRRASLAALRTLTGASVGSTRDAWAGWIAAQREQAKDFAREGLGDRDDLRALSLRLQAVVRHPFAAAQLVPDLIGLLGHREPSVASLAAATLARLGALEAGKALAETVESRDAGLAKAAHEALVQLTGETHEASTRAWLRALGV